MYWSRAMRKKILATFCLIATAAGLTACSQKKQINHQNMEKSSVAQKQAPTRLIVKELGDKEKASAITIYGAMNYKGAWQTAYKDAVKNHLSISVKNRTGFSWIKQGRGFINEVTGNGREHNAFYTSKGDTIYFYNEKRKLGSASLEEITSYLNKRDQFTVVQKLAANTTLAASVTSNKYGVKGDDGLALVPVKLRGTWYNYKGEKLTATAHTINDEEIHQISNSGIAATSLAQTKKWARARIEDINGLNCYHVRTLNSQDFGLLYSVQKSGENTAVVTYSVATGHYTATYWKSTKIAREHRHAEFRTLN